MRDGQQYLSGLTYVLFAVGGLAIAGQVSAQAAPEDPPPAAAPPVEAAPAPAEQAPPEQAPPEQAPPEAPPPSAASSEPETAPAADGDYGATTEPEGAAAAIAPSDAAKELGAVVITGVRGGQARTVADSPSPIDVIGHEELIATGRTGLKEILGAVVPSLTMPAQGGGGTSASVRPYTYRGLSGDYLLVLVNGKRRHTTSLINNLSRLSGGSTPVDLDLIPTPAISRIEILRDGAAAQYGSDAIGGVLNLILDDAPEGLTVSQSGGAYYEGGGELLQEQASLGIPLGTEGGFIRFSAEAKLHNPSKSAASPLPTETPDGKPNLFYPSISVDQRDPREAAASKHVFTDGYGRSNRDIILGGTYNFELPLSNKLKLYSFSTLTHRNIKDARGYLRPNDLRTLPEIYPNGFQAYRRIWEVDGQATAGVKSEVEGWAWDLSTSYGRDWVRLGAENTLNPSLGPRSPTSFFMGKQIQDLWVNNLDISKGIPIGLAEPLLIAFGIEHRWEQFQNKAGEPDSYRDGGYTVPVGDDPWHQAPLPDGLGGFGGLSPSPSLASFTGTSKADARKLDRHNLAGYVDLSTNLTKRWFLGAAGRAEHYTDSAGNTVSGKLVTRVELAPGLALRGGINSGFRAPSLAQTGFSTTQNTVTIIGGERVSTTSKFLPVDSAAAQALGARPLKPEKSLSFTGGVSWEPDRSFRITLDGFQTAIDDRIVRTEFLGTANNGGAAVRELLVSNGISNVDSAQFFTNAIDTTTRGVDIVAEYTLRQSWGQLRPSAAFTYASTKIDKVASKPAELRDLDVSLYGRQGRLDLTQGVPRTKLVLGFNWQVWRFKGDIRLTRYGSYLEASTTEGNDREFGAKFVTDAEVGYGITDNVTLAIGAYNLFDVRPDANGIVGLQDGTGRYGSFAPFGLNGGFYYGRLTVNL